MYNFHDAKLWGIKFNLDFLFNHPGFSTIILDLDYPVNHKWRSPNELITTLCPCYLYFKEVEFFTLDIKSGNPDKNQMTIESDSLFIESIEKNEDGSGEWNILFLNGVGEIKIRCNEAHLELHRSLSVEVEMECHIPLSIRRALVLPPPSCIE